MQVFCTYIMYVYIIESLCKLSNVKKIPVRLLHEYPDGLYVLRIGPGEDALVEGLQSLTQRFAGVLPSKKSRSFSLETKL